MDKITATKEARIGALYEGGDWYVTRWKRGCYKALPHNRYRGRIDGALTPPEDDEDEQELPLAA